MMSCIILFALGQQEGAPVRVRRGRAQLSRPLSGLGLYALYGGVVLYLVNHFGFRLRNLGSVNWFRTGAMAVLVALVPVVANVPVLVALGLLAGVCVGTVVLETTLFADGRRALRESTLAEPD